MRVNSAIQQLMASVSQSGICVEQIAKSEIQDRIDKAARMRRMTRDELAVELGISTKLLSDYMDGKKKLDIDIVCKMRKPLGVSLDWLLLGESNSTGLMSLHSG